MGLFNIFSTNQSGTKEQSSPRSEQPRLSAGYKPAVIAEMEEAHLAIERTRIANQRHPNTHPHLVTQVQLDRLAEPALQGTYTSENEQIRRANEQLERTLEMMGLSGQPNTASRPSEANDLSAEAISPDMIAQAQARVAASYRVAQPSVSTPQNSTDMQSTSAQEYQNV